MRPLTATIRLSHLRHNYQLLRRLHGNKMLAVVKADAYGHGAVRCARALADLADKEALRRSARQTLMPKARATLATWRPMVPPPMMVRVLPLRSMMGRSLRQKRPSSCQRPLLTA